MKIQYTDRTRRITSDNPADIHNCLSMDLGSDYVYANGLVWRAEDAEEYPNDDGQHASAKLWYDNGEEAIDFEF